MEWNDTLVRKDFDTFLTDKSYELIFGIIFLFNK